MRRHTVSICQIEVFRFSTDAAGCRRSSGLTNLKEESCRESDGIEKKEYENKAQSQSLVGEHK